jgi:hypothetical protein
MTASPKGPDFVVSRYATGNPDLPVMWMLFRGRKHIKGQAFLRKYEAVAAAKKLALKAKAKVRIA